MRILHVTPSYKPAFVYGGPTLSVSQLCEHQAAIGEEVAVVATTANGSRELPAGQSRLEGVNVQYFKRITGDHTHFSPALLHYLWKHCKHYDIIHVHSWWNLVSVLATLVCWLRGVQPVLSPRGMLSSFSFTQHNSVKKKIIHALVGNWLLRTTCLHATSTLEWNDAHAVYPAWKGFILPNIIDLPEARFTYPSPSQRLKIVFLSRIHPKKGLELTMEALAQCKFPFVLEVYGDGESDYVLQLKVLANELGISESVIWKGWVGGEAKYEALAKSDIFVLTSYNENFANVVLESLAVGTPVLVSDQVGAADYVESRNLGKIVDLRIDSIHKALVHFYDHRDSLPSLRKKAVSQVRKDFNGGLIAKNYCNTISNYTKNQTHGAVSGV